MSAYVQGAFDPAGTTVAGTTTVALDLPGAATVGNQIIIGILTWSDANDRAVSSIVDAAGTTYTSRGTRALIAMTAWVAIYSGEVTATNAGQDVVITFAASMGGASVRVSVLEVSGVATDQSSAQYNSGTSSGLTSHSSGSVTPTNSSDFVYALRISGSGTYTDDADFTEVGGTPTAADREFMGYIENRSAAIAMDFTYVDPETSAQAIVSLVGAAAGGAVSSVPAILQNYRNMRLMS